MEQATGQVLFAGAMGFLAGFAVTAICGRWLGLFLMALRGVRRPDNPCQMSSGSPRGASLLLLAHPAPWLLCGLLPYLAYRYLWSHPSAQAPYFFGALLACVCLQVLAVRYVFYRARRDQARRKAEQTTGDESPSEPGDPDG